MLGVPREQRPKTIATLQVDELAELLRRRDEFTKSYAKRLADQVRWSSRNEPSACIINLKVTGANRMGVDLIFTMVSTTYRHTIAGM